MTTATKEITNSDDTIDVRDVIDHIEHLEGEPTINAAGECYYCGIDIKEGDEDHEYDCEILELQRLNALLDQLRGNGGDHEWRGDWYPVTLIRDSYFEDYARELADDIGAINAESVWPNNHIDWKAAAEELQGDYSTADFDGVDYHYR